MALWGWPCQLKVLRVSVCRKAWGCRLGYRPSHHQISVYFNVNNPCIKYYIIFSTTMVYVVCIFYGIVLRLWSWVKWRGSLKEFLTYEGSLF